MRNTTKINYAPKTLQMNEPYRCTTGPADDTVVYNSQKLAVGNCENHGRRDGSIDFGEDATETESKVEACGEDSGTENLNTPECVTVAAAEGDQRVNDQIQNRKGGLNQWKNHKVAAYRYAS